MSNNSTNKSSGIGFFGLLTILFIALKLMGEITWSWWWVLAPLWITWSLALVIFVLVALVFATKALQTHRKGVR